MVWVKGQSGNPIGGQKRRTKADVIELAQKASIPAIRRLALLLGDPDPDIQLRAAVALLDRGFGKPAQALAIASKDFTNSARELAPDIHALLDGVTGGNLRTIEATPMLLNGQETAENSQ